MARNVLKAGYALRAYNRTAAKAEALRPLGATIVASPREAAARADSVITMVSDPPALAAVLEGPDGALAGCRAGALVIDMSTVDPGTSQAMATGRSLGVPLSSLETVAELQASALAKGLGDLDQTATIQVLEEIAGVQVRKR